ncbi:beta family protein [Nostoc sp. CHAB 5836]|nr:beta family protein [Nostoc sp. CHAB 5836]
MDFNAFCYVPIIGVRPSEMQALEELPPNAKNGILPFVVLQPWTTAREFPSTLVKVAASTAGKPIIVDVTEEIFVGTRRPVHSVFDRLRDPADGYAAWRGFIDENEAFTPVVQLNDPNSIVPQIRAFKAMGRGVVIRLHEQIFRFGANIAQLFKVYSYNSDVYFILDFQRQDRSILLKALLASNICKSIRDQLPDCFISVSASTFPTSFTDIVEQEIFERRFYSLVTDQIGSECNIYCDRASVRAEKQSGGGGTPAPRIDNALLYKWKFFREAEEDDRDDAYQAAAARATNCPDWIDLGIWGTEMIKKTAAGEENAIYSPKMSTSARINIHMYTQAGLRASVTDTEWTDV